jgi:hypothetical protein
MVQLQELQSRVEMMQEEAYRERSEKEALLRSNERLQHQVDKLLKIAALRTSPAAESLEAARNDPVADAEAVLENRIAALEYRRLKPESSNSGEADALSSSTGLSVTRASSLVSQAEVPATLGSTSKVLAPMPESSQIEDPGPPRRSAAEVQALLPSEVQLIRPSDASQASDAVATSDDSEPKSPHVVRSHAVPSTGAGRSAVLQAPSNRSWGSSTSGAGSLNRSVASGGAGASVARPGLSAPVPTAHVKVRPYVARADSDAAEDLLCA